VSTQSYPQFVDPTAGLKRKLDALSLMSGLFFSAVGITNACGKRHPELREEAQATAKKYMATNFDLFKRSSFRVADSIKAADAKDFWPAYNHVTSKEMMISAEEKMAAAYPDLESCRIGLRNVAAGLNDLGTTGVDLLTTILGDQWREGK